MPGALLRRGALPLALALVLGGAAFHAGGQPRAAPGTAEVSVEVPGGKTKTIRLRNLPRGTQLAVRIDADGTLVVALVSAAQLKSQNPQAVFRAALDRRISFRVAVPESGHYYLVLDNRAGSQSVNARATMQVRRPPAGGGKPAPPRPRGKLDET